MVRYGGAVGDGRAIGEIGEVGAEADDAGLAGAGAPGEGADAPAVDEHETGGGQRPADGLLAAGGVRAGPEDVAAVDRDDDRRAGWPAGLGADGSGAGWPAGLGADGSEDCVAGGDCVVRVDQVELAGPPERAGERRGGPPAPVGIGGGSGRGDVADVVDGQAVTFFDCRLADKGAEPAG